MFLSNEQQTLVAQLVLKQDQPAECFGLIHLNAKTRAFGDQFVKHGLITIAETSVELLPKFFTEAHRNGITDESGNLTEDGEGMSKETIEETFRFFRAMLLASS